VLYLAGLAFVAFALLTLALTVFRVPGRSAEVSLGGQQIRVTIGMVPDPPRTGPIPLQITIRDKSGNPVDVEEVLVGYGMEGDPGARTVATPAASAGLFRAQIGFVRVGQGWIELDVRRGQARAPLRFPVDVRPNI
ncbi:MAG: hypothetical protein ACRDF1_02040, partial [bacterium]